jgi:peptidoglycan/LPS O-acetylase OafA/YrhL
MADPTTVADMPPSTASVLAARTPTTRDRAIDALRVASLAVVMVGHTLMATVEPGGRVGNVLTALPQAQLLTWLFQVVPVFFLVGGFGHAAALRVRPDGSGPSYGAFVASRMTRLLPPAAVLCAVWLSAGLLLELTGTDDGLPRTAARVAVQPLWFLGVYVAVVASAPAMLALHRRFGLRVVGALALATGLLDLLRFSADDGALPGVCYLSVGTVWLAVHSLGFAWFDGTLEGHGRALALGGLSVAAALVLSGPYPTSMVGLPGAPVSNMSPPTLALLAHAVWLTGLVVLLRPRLRRTLSGRRAWTAVVAANGVCMTAFLWHLTALFAVLGLTPRLRTASPGWWATRPLVVTATLLGTALLVAAFRRFERSSALPVRTGLVVGAGAAAAAAGLLTMSATGAVGVLSGRRASLAGFEVTPTMAAALLGVGIVLLGVLRVPARVGTGHVAQRFGDPPPVARPADLGRRRSDRRPVPGRVRGRTMAAAARQAHRAGEPDGRTGAR